MLLLKLQSAKKKIAILNSIALFSKSLFKKTGDWTGLTELLNLNVLDWIIGLWILD